MTTFHITDAVRSALVAAGTDVRQREDEHRRAAEALDRARQVVADAQTEVERLSGVESAWLDRQTRRLAEWIREPRGEPPATTADSKSMLAMQTARANHQAAQAALPQFAEAEAAALAGLQGAQAMLESVYRDCHRTHVAELIAELEEHQSASERLRAQIAAPEHAAGVFGMRERFGGLLTAAQVERLNAPPSHLDLAQLFADHRPVVGLHDSISGAHSSALSIHLEYWQERQRFLEEVAAGGSAPAQVEAA